ESGLVDRTPDPGDSRAGLRRATPAGGRALAASRTRIAHELEPMIHRLDADDRPALARPAELLAARTTQAVVPRAAPRTRTARPAGASCASPARCGRSHSPA